MKKFFFVAILGGLVACGDAGNTTTTLNEDSLKAAKVADSIKNATSMQVDTANKQVDTTAKKTDTTASAAKADTAAKKATK